MIHEVFTCETYEVKNGILVIYNPILIGKVDGIESEYALTRMVQCKAIVCPDLFTKYSGKKITGYLFEKL